MVAKLITYGEDRPAAIARMHQTLEQCAVFGVKTNAPLLYAITTSHGFQEGRTYTSFLHDYGLLGDGGFQKNTSLPNEVVIAAILYDSRARTGHNALHNHYQCPTHNPWHMLGPWRTVGEALHFSYRYRDSEHTAMLRPFPPSGKWSIQIDEQPPEEISW